MLGHAIFQTLNRTYDQPVFGTVRRTDDISLVDSALQPFVKVIPDLMNVSALSKLVDELRPTVIINCTSLQKSDFNDLPKALALYAVFPKRLSIICKQRNVRLIQISSDGVFSGEKGNYRETDVPDAEDVYGLTKFLGEVDGEHVVTIRTSIIGHQLKTSGGLVDWFLMQKEPCRCYSKAIFSGFPTVVLADIIGERILPRPELSGLFHIASDPISKFDLLKLVSCRYGHGVEMISDDSVTLDRSLSGEKFENATGFSPPPWSELIDALFKHHNS